MSAVGEALGAPREAGFITKTLALVRKDMLTETRARDTLPPMLAFSLAVTLLLAFTLPGAPSFARPVTVPFGTAPLADVLGGFLWITVLFAGLIGFARTFETESHENAIDSLLLVPVDRSALFVAKATANLAFIALVQVVLIPAFMLLFDARLGSGWAAFILVVALVDIGFVAIGTLFAALAAQTTSRELILPILALPALVPVFIAAVELTSDLLLGEGLGAVAQRGWFGILVAYDLVFAIVGALAFEFALEG
jgi:heme exporter protein B